MLTHAEHLWVPALRGLAKTLTNEELNYLLNLQPELVDGVFRLRAPFPLFQRLVEEKYQERIDLAMRRKVPIVCVSGGVTSVDKRPWHKEFEVGVSRGASKTLRQAPPKKSFASFIEGESNQLALMAMVAISRQALAESVFLEGPLGHGKSHLMLAAYHARLAKGEKVRYVTGDDFARTVLAGTASEAHAALGLAQAELVFVDDVDRLAGSSRARDRATAILERLSARGCQLVCSGEISLDELAQSSSVLAGLFTNGLSVKIDSLTLDLRMAYLDAMVTARNLVVNRGVLESEVSRYTGGMREVEGLIARVCAGLGLGVTVVAGEDGKSTFVLNGRRTRLSLRDIIEIVAKARNYTIEDLCGRDRRQNIAWTRHEAAYLCRKLLKESYPEIGRALGGRNHTSVMRAVREVEARKVRDQHYRKNLQSLEQLIRFGVSTGEQERKAS